MKIGYMYLYVIAVLVFMFVDGIWLKTMTASFYRPRIGHLLTDTPNMLAAGVFYLFYIFALSILIIFPQIKAEASLLHIFALGGLMGLMAYGTYDFTALALMKDYDTTAAIVDFIWGGFVTGTVCVVTAWLNTKFNLL